MEDEICSRCGNPLEARAGRSALHVPTRRERLAGLLRTYRRAIWIGLGGGVVAVALVFLVLLGLQDTGREERAPAAAEAAATQGPEAGEAIAPAPPEEGGAGTVVDPPHDAGVLAAGMDAAVREAGFEPRLLKDFPQRSGGPRDAVLLGVQGLDRESFRRLLQVVTARFQDEDGSAEAPALGRVSLVLTDSLGVVRKHEIQRGEGLKAAASDDALEEMAERFGIATYPEPDAQEKSRFEAPRPEPAQPEGEAGATAPPAPGEEAGESAAAEPAGGPEIRYTPHRARVEVLRLMVRSRFPEVTVEDDPESVVVRGPEAILKDVRLFLEQVDDRTGKR